MRIPTFDPQYRKGLQPDYSNMYPYQFDVPPMSPVPPMAPQDPYNLARLAQEEDAKRQAYYDAMMQTVQDPVAQPPMPGLSKQQGWIAGGLGLLSALSGPQGNAPGIAGNFVQQTMKRNTDQWQQALDAQKEQRAAELKRKELKAKMAQLDYEDKAREHGQAVNFKHQDEYLAKQNQLTQDRQLAVERTKAEARVEAQRLIQSGKPWAQVQQVMDYKYGPGMWGEEQLLANPGLVQAITGHNVNTPALTAAQTDSTKKATERAQRLQPLVEDKLKLQNWNTAAIGSINWEKYDHYDDELALKLAMFDLKVKQTEHQWSKDTADQFWKENGQELQSTVSDLEKAIPKAKDAWGKAKSDLAAVKNKIAALEATGTRDGKFDPSNLNETNQVAYETAKAELAEKQAAVGEAADAYIQAQNDYAERNRTLNDIRARRPAVSNPGLPAVTKRNHPPIAGGIPKSPYAPVDIKSLPNGELAPAAILPIKKLKAQTAADALDQLGL